MAKAKNEVAKVDEDTARNEILNYDFGDDAGEEFSSDDVVIPFLNLLQGQSKIVLSGDLPGARAGLWYNTATGELMEEFNFLPVYKEEQWVEWVPRENSGGVNSPVGMYDPDSPEVQAILDANNGDRVPPKGADGKREAFKLGANDLIETHYIQGLVLADDGETVLGYGIIAINGSKILPMKKWNYSRLSLKGQFGGKQLPLYAHRVRIGSTSEVNPAGDLYKGASFSPVGTSWLESVVNPRSNLYAEGKAFLALIEAGKTKVDFSKQEDGGGGVAESGGGSRKVPDVDDKEPF